MKNHLLVPLSGTPESESVLKQLRRLARRGSTITLLRAEMPSALEGYTEFSDAALRHARHYLEDVRERLGNLDVRVRIVARIGSPADCILEVAREVEATAILLSGGHRAGLARFLFGSVAGTVVKHSAVPVLVIPAGAEEVPAFQIS
jgi:nucleotide-binding universal stress UspA family protein